MSDSTSFLIVLITVIGIFWALARITTKEQQRERAEAQRQAVAALPPTAAPERPPKPPKPRQSAHKPKPDKSLVYEAADACLALAEALERKAEREPVEIKKCSFLARAAAQRLKAEKLAIQAG